MARAGESRRAAAATGGDQGPRSPRVGRLATRPARSRSSTCAAPRARTSGRSPATWARGSAAAPTSAALVRTASGPFTLEAARSLDEIRDAAAAAGPDGVRALLLPVRHRAGRAARRRPDDRGDRRRARRAASSGPRPALRGARRGRAAAPRRTPRGVDRRAWAGAKAPAMAPTKIAASLSDGPAWRPTRAMAVVHGIDALEPPLGRLFVVVGVFDGLHLGHAYLLDAARSTRPPTRGARPAVITFDHHPDEILTGSAPPLLCDPDERLRAPGGGGRRGDGRPDLRRRAARDAVTTRSSGGSPIGSTSPAS